MKKALFISWDGPQSSYMESLFMPILHGVAGSLDIEFHVIQFTWAGPDKIAATQRAAAALRIRYTAIPIYRKPLVALGSIYTLLTGWAKIEKYIKANNINLLFPRSIYPAYMVNRLRHSLEIIYDADGLPLEEKIEAGFMKRNSAEFRFFTGVERKILQRAAAVLVRSVYATRYFTDHKLIDDPDKVFRVVNGRQTDSFTYNALQRATIRQQLGISESDILLIYVGSLGGKYLIDEILELYQYLRTHSASYKLLVLSNSEFSSSVPDLLYRSVDFSQVGGYLSAADAGLCFISQSLSMTAVAATKIGEYLIAGLPTITSAKIGDIDSLLTGEKGIFFHNNQPSEFPAILQWLQQTDLTGCRTRIAQLGVQYFSLQAATASYIEAFNHASSKNSSHLSIKTGLV